MRLPILAVDRGVLNGCFHTPPCTSASVHHARRGHHARIAREGGLDLFAPVPPTLQPPLPAEVGPNFVASPAHRRTVFRGALHHAPWEMTAEEFDAVAEPFLAKTVGSSQPRMFGLSVSTMRFGLRVRLMVEGGPEEGYLADIAADDEASLRDARRAFVAEALAHGAHVPGHVLADYPDLAPHRALDQAY
ncbi:MAG: hypothetical protein JOZ65_14725 [Chloroflexi bacterium]|nr:hypothetical protein [Chloroflexota bacterium]